MIAYLDSSVLLRIVLGQPDKLDEFGKIRVGIGSSLVEVECLRTLDRLRLQQALSDDDLATRRETVFRLVRSMYVVDLTAPVLARAAQPLPTTLGTLDAIHLSTALLWRGRITEEMVMATHDRALATAARACGFLVLGVPERAT
jgi:predicted nucleic acid-binding protein